MMKIEDIEKYDLYSVMEANIGLYWFLWFQGKNKDYELLQDIKRNTLPILTVKKILHNFKDNEFLAFDDECIMIDRNIRIDGL